MDASTFKIKTPCLTGGRSHTPLPALTLRRSASTIIRRAEKILYTPIPARITHSWCWTAKQLSTIKKAMPPC